MESGGLPNGPARRAELTAMRSNAVDPLAFVTPVRTIFPSSLPRTISTNVTRFSLNLWPGGRLDRDVRNSSAKMGWMRLCIVLRYVAKALAAALRDVWLPGLTPGW